MLPTGERLVLMHRSNEIQVSNDVPVGGAFACSIHNTFCRPPLHGQTATLNQMSLMLDAVCCNTLAET